MTAACAEKHHVSAHLRNCMCKTEGFVRAAEVVRFNNARFGLPRASPQLARGLDRAIHGVKPVSQPFPDVSS
jgi:hypothetical protein